jgi:hypothetical protein
MGVWQGVDQLKTLLPPLAKPAPPLIQKTDDKLTAVKKTVNVALFDLEKTLTTAHNILASAQVRTHRWSFALQRRVGWHGTAWYGRPPGLNVR